MLQTELLNKLIEDSYEFARNQLLTPSNLGLLKSGSKKLLVGYLEQINLNELVNISTRDEYDDWFDNTLLPIHMDLFNIYQKSLNVTQDNPYTYSARILTQYIKTLCFRTWLYDDYEIYLDILHPMLTNNFLESFPELQIKKVKEISGRSEYYNVIEFYRDMIEQDKNDKNEALIGLEMCKDF
ncbi:hypothetical protein [Fodinibius sediminis]|uniref:Uncharacterized protein n=1 Tax=Fodinibius sediminis TaxID=1214077 RepID=A0A521F8Y4_9BACT|nr:hypothetical protein [Fodinibius sediminis]SMO92504.1 hypothetical protein SAMN06265218_12610 [Fodinibius sediminis]